MLKRMLLIIIVCLSSSAALADIQLPSIINDGMVIQQNQDFNVWGWSDDSKEVTVKGSWLKAGVSAKVGADGKWQTKIPAPKAGGPYTLEISSAADKVVLEDILCGEVWVCSGQSNMDMGLRLSENGKEEAAKADHPEIRLFHIPRVSSLTEQKTVDAKWNKCNPQTVQEGVWQGFSAVGYYFGKKLHEELGVPIGLVKTAFGGSCIETWTPTFAFKDSDKLGFIYDKLITYDPASKGYKAKFESGIDDAQQWIKDAKTALANDEIVPDFPAIAKNPKHGRKELTGLYNAMLAPIVPFSMKGVIWYQGEQNLHRGDGTVYYEKMKTMIGGWRKVWGNGDFPFYYAQIAPYKKYRVNTSLPMLWEAQAAALDIPNTAMVVTTDIANLNDIHPKKKKEVGYRLANIALTKNYGRDGIVISGPVYKSMKKEGSKLRLSFDYAKDGLKTSDGKAPNYFEIAAKDEKFVKASAKIEGSTVVVYSDKVKKPAVVRFGWNKTANPNLRNKAGLPASPFRTNARAYRLPKGRNLALNKKYDGNSINKKGWDDGLTDGSWLAQKDDCFATESDSKFPKYVTIDLEKAYKVHSVYVGVPYFGSTRACEILISKDGKKFKKVNAWEFAQGENQRKRLDFAPSLARYVRIQYLNKYEKNNGYNTNYMFMTEVEVYGE